MDFPGRFGVGVHDPLRKRVVSSGENKKKGTDEKTTLTLVTNTGCRVLPNWHVKANCKAMDVPFTYGSPDLAPPEVQHTCQRYSFPTHQANVRELWP